MYLTGGWGVEFQKMLSLDWNPDVEVPSTHRSYSPVVSPFSTAMQSNTWLPGALPSNEKPSLKLW